MNPSLKEAQKLLHIKNITLQSSYVKLGDDIDNDFLSEADISIQTFRGVPKVREASFESDEKNWWEYLFYYSVGVRLVEENTELEDNEVTPFVEIKGTFCAKYESTEKLTQEHIDAFSEKNVGFNVWPYWRELVQSSCMRLGIEPIEVPLYFC